MQSHWKKWGPPVYVSAAGYLKNGTHYSKSASRSPSGSRKGSLPDKPEAHESTTHEVKDGNLNELLSFFGGGGAIKA
jgi:hypothetical protein